MSAKPKKGMPKWVLLTLLAVMLLAALAAFPAYNYLTGVRKLAQVRAELKAQGLPVDYVEVLPLADPPDKATFARHPFIQTFYMPDEVIGADYIGEEPIPLDPEKLSEEQIEFLEMFEDHLFYKVAASRGAGLGFQAMFDAEAAAEAMELEFEPGEAMAAIVGSFSPDNERMAELKAAAQLPAGNGPRERYRLDNPLETTGSHLSHFLSLARLCTFRATVFLEQGESRKAYEELAVAFRLVALLEDEPAILPFVVRITILRLAINPVWYGLATQQWAEPELRALQKELTLTPLNLAVADVIWSDGVTMTETLTSDHAREAYEDLPQWPGSIEHNAANLLSSYHELVTRVRQGDWGAISGRVVPPSMKAKLEQRNWVMVAALLPSCESVIGKAFTSEAVRQCALAAVDLELHYQEHGAYPADLMELEGSYPDPFRKGSLIYVTKGQDRFLLYSIGANLRDDKGTIVYRSSGAMDEKSGDIAWSYPAP